MKLKKVIFGLGILLSLFSSGTIALADGGHSSKIDSEKPVSLTIEQSENDSVNAYQVDLLKVNAEKSFDEKDASTFSIENSQEIDMSGHLTKHLSKLEQGYYRVTPLDSSRKPAQEPYYISLPVVEDGKVQYDVTLYPKKVEKSIVTGVNPAKEKLLQTGVKDLKIHKGLIAIWILLTIAGVGTIIWKLSGLHDKAK